MDDSTYIELLRAIREHSGLELSEIRSAGEHGADAGWSGFTWYADTVEFYDTHEALLWKILGDDADDFGYDSVPAFVASFARAEDAGDPTGFKNLISWYALEACGRHLADRRESRC